MSAETLRRTPLYETHVAARARLVPFAGWEMPVQYTGVLPEVKAVREGVGLFDVSHMGRLALTGPDVEAYVQHLIASDASTLADGKGQYSLLCNETGGIVDDIIVYRRTESLWWIVYNAGCLEKDRAWFQKHAAGFNVTLADFSDDVALIAVQGPQAIALLGESVGALPRFGIADVEVLGYAVTAARTGYTGEDGAELFVANADAPGLWSALVAAGAVPCGLGARDTLRVEAALPLYGHEMDEGVAPFEARLGWVVKLEKAVDFVGKAALTAIKAGPKGRITVGIEIEGRGIPREGYPVHAPGGDAIGHVTSGTFSPMRQKGVAFARLAVSHAKVGTPVDVMIRDIRHAARVVALPFYKNV